MALVYIKSVNGKQNYEGVFQIFWRVAGLEIYYNKIDVMRAASIKIRLHYWNTGGFNTDIGADQYTRNDINPRRIQGSRNKYQTFTRKGIKNQIGSQSKDSFL